MRLEDMTVGLLRRALEIYRAHAYETEPPPVLALPAKDGAPLAESLGLFLDESRRTGQELVHRYALRLGNSRYPFMKLVLQECLVEGEYFFEVNTHDGMFELGDPHDATTLEALKRWNLTVKTKVELALGQAGLPTAADLRGLISTNPVPRAPKNGRRILVVDDDQAIAATVATLLEARGYEVDVLHDGIEAVDSADPDRHDLILMDNEMPRLNGFSACGVLKSRERTAAIPVLIATAGALTLNQLDAADGFLVKPFRMELLLSMIEHMLAHRQEL